MATTRRNQQIELNEIARSIPVREAKSYANVLATLSHKIRKEYGDNIVHFEIINPRSGEFRVGADKFQIVINNGKYQII